MKKFLPVVAFMLLASFMHSQNSWKISLNKKTVLTSSEQNELINTKKIKTADWKATGFLEIVFKETTLSNWLHSIQLNDETGNPLFVKDSTTSAKIPIASLRKLFAGKKEMKIYMMINPPNPMMLAPSRMLHLGTLRLP